MIKFIQSHQTVINKHADLITSEKFDDSYSFELMSAPSDLLNEEYKCKADGMKGETIALS